MSCFDYPVDSQTILLKKRALRKELLQKEGLVDKKIAILSGKPSRRILSTSIPPAAIWRTAPPSMTATRQLRQSLPPKPPAGRACGMRR